MRIRHIDRTATVAWSPGQHAPFLASGTVAGALDASFSTTTELEIFDLNLNDTSAGGRQLRRLGVTNAAARFNRLAWGHGDPSRPYGILAAGLENGQLDLWNPKAIIDGEGSKALMLQQSMHAGQVRGLDFNPLQHNLLASGATDGEIFIWDLTNPTKPYSPGARSQKLEDITTLSWNRVVPHILATASNNGYTVVWDLRNRREIIKLAHPGGRKPIMGVAWNPDLPTQVVTASDDDHNPVLLIWDLRNASAPERTLSGHQKGVLSVAWCSKDSDLLLSCAKDNSTLAWNPTTGEVIGELAHSNNWAFDVQWCPRNPDLVTVASFDGKVSVHSLQAAGTPEDDVAEPLPAPPSDPNDPFANIAYQNQINQQHSSASNFKLTNPPKWLKRPAGAVWGYGGKLVSFEKRSVSVRTVPTYSPFVQRIDDLECTIADGSIEAYMAFCERRALAQDEGDAVTAEDREIWNFLKVLLEPDARAKIVDYLGFSRETIGQDRLAGLLERLKVSARSAEEAAPPSVAAPPNGVASKDANGLDNLFGADDIVDDFPVSASVEDISAASRVSNEPFALFPSGKRGEEVDVDILITRSLILGDFETAVDIALAADRLADALMFAVSGGAELLARVQAEYFRRTRIQKSYARLLRSVLDGDLLDVVQNAELEGKEGGWKDILALICTYGKTENIARLFGILGRRLEGLGPVGGAKGDNSRTTEGQKFAAALCYLSAGDFGKVVALWGRREAEEETKLRQGAGLTKGASVSGYGSHLLALQSLIEKVAVFRKAVGFVDTEVSSTPPAGGYKLEALYSHYAEYAEAAAAQGRVGFAWSTLELVPDSFQWASKKSTLDPEIAIAVLKDRLFGNGGVRQAVSARPHFPYQHIDIAERIQPAVTAATQPHDYYHGYQQTAAAGGYAGYQPATSYQPTPAQQTPASSYPGFAAQSSYFPGAQANQSYPGASYTPAPAGSGYNFGPSADYPAYQPSVPATPAMPPPPPVGGAPPSQPASSIMGGGAGPAFGDAPVVSAGHRHVARPPPPPATSPFPNAPPTPGPTGGIAPPPMGGSSWQQQPAAPALPPPPPTGGYTPTPAFQTSASPAPGRRTPFQPAPPPTAGFGQQGVAPPPAAAFQQHQYPGAGPASGSQDYQAGGFGAGAYGGGYGGQQQQSGYGAGAGYGAYNQAPQTVASPPPTGYGGQPRTSSLQQPAMGRPASTPPATQPPVPPASAMSPPPTPRTPGAERASAASPATPTAAAAGSSKFPPGDRSQIPAAHRPLYEGFQKYLDAVRSFASTPQSKRMFDDAERKLNIFYDQLNSGEITQQDVLDRMAELLRCLDSRDYQGAQKIQIDLLTTRFDVTGRWMLGVKRLIEFIKDAAQAGALQH
ncbi:protein transport protein S31 [Rhizophlyctis rosea]|uniref:Protein transport protein SEC31 n=1 Tax=Rhizophlyctis rosea TaxID=64517 RepID=A0AAD5X525_9FUNG|nr:protein transport protein S31 [Rhizophlyctis rosea]